MQTLVLIDYLHYPMRATSTGTIVFTWILVALLTASVAHRHSELHTVTSHDKTFEVSYTGLLLVCAHRDGENPDVWSPKECAADIPVCDSSGHAENVLLCLAYPISEFSGTNLQAAAFAVSRIDNFNAHDCAQKWSRTNTTNFHSEKISGLKFQVAQAQETANSHVSDQYIFRVVHRGACYEMDVNLTTALDTAFAAEDVPRKLTALEQEMIKNSLLQALHRFRFLK